MKTQPARRQSGNCSAPHPLWMRLLTVFCMALLAGASTVQVCHSHDEALQPGLTKSSSLAHASAQFPSPSSPTPDTNSAVNCPLCVAMHSALPVTHSLTNVEMLRVAPTVIAVATPKRLFLWHFQLASRPPPVVDSRTWLAAA